MRNPPKEILLLTVLLLSINICLGGRSKYGKCSAKEPSTLPYTTTIPYDIDYKCQAWRLYWPNEGATGSSEGWYCKQLGCQGSWLFDPDVSEIYCCECDNETCDGKVINDFTCPGHYETKDMGKSWQCKYDGCPGSYVRQKLQWTCVVSQCSLLGGNMVKTKESGYLCEHKDCDQWIDLTTNECKSSECSSSFEETKKMVPYQSDKGEIHYVCQEHFSSSFVSVMIGVLILTIIFVSCLIRIERIKGPQSRFYTEKNEQDYQSSYYMSKDELEHSKL